MNHEYIIHFFSYPHYHISLVLIRAAAEEEKEALAENTPTINVLKQPLSIYLSARE